MRLMVLLSLLCLVRSLPAADWPQFRGPRADGISPETGINKTWTVHPPAKRWTVPLSDDGYAGPAVAGGIVYIVDHQGDRDIVRALDLRTGKELWRYAYADTKTRVWGYARATPTIRNGKVYVQSRLGKVLCLQAKTGTLLWSRDIIADFKGKRPQWDLCASPLVDDNRLIVCPGGKNAAVVALDPATGKTLWQGGGSDVPGYATPVAATLAGVKQYVVFACYSLLGVEAATGKLLWRLPWMTPLQQDVDTPQARAHFNANAAAPVISGNTIFITTGYKHGSALINVTKTGAKLLWTSTAMQSQYSAPIASGGYVYCTSDPGKLVCLALTSGKVQWTAKGFEKGGLAAVDGTLLVMDGRTGAVVQVAMSPKGYRELGRITPLGGESRTAPVIADGALLVRNRKALVCLELRSP